MKARIAIALGVVALAAFALIHSNYTPAFNNQSTTMQSASLSLKIPAFANNAAIPSKYTCDGQKDLSPAMAWSGVPADAKSLALIMDDPDVPRAIKPDGLFVHWVLFNIPPDATGIPEGGTAGLPGVNGSGSPVYTGPCPPLQYQPSEHRYFFKLYALDAMLNLPAGSTKDQVERATQGHILEEVQYIGRYQRTQ